MKFSGTVSFLVSTFLPFSTLAKNNGGGNGGGGNGGGGNGGGGNGGGGGGGGNGGPIVTCSQQAQCLDFSIRKTDGEPTVCTDGNCEFKVCMKLDYSNLGCVKGSGTVSHSCNKNPNQCRQDKLNIFKGDSVENNGVANGEEHCVYVKGGGIAQFLLKDGNGACGHSHAYVDGSTVTCAQYNPAAFGVDKSCTGSSNECLWSVTVPQINTGGCDGDPHIQLWNNTRFDYHGECDLVLLDNKDFADGLGLDIHLRTTQEPYADIPAFYSYIENAAIRIGNDILEFVGDKFWINGVKGSDDDLPMTVGGEFPLHYPTFTEDGAAKHYLIDLHGDDYILVYNFQQFMSVVVSGGSKDFGNSIGLMGHFHTGNMMARDGLSILSNTDEYGSEWQVHEDEPKLFRTMREPQHPRAACKVPKNVAETHRHLRMDTAFVQAAESACAHKSANHFDSCVYDVLATHNLGMANAWGF